MTTSTTLLSCVSCDAETEHELVWAGRVLQSVRCTVCGLEVRHEQRDLMFTYVHDLEHRIITKPLRMVRRALREPGPFFRELPGAVLRQPGKLIDEWLTVLRDRRRD